MKFKYQFNILSSLLLLSLFVFTACEEDDTDAGLTERTLLLNVINDQPNLSVFAQLIEDNGLTGELVGNRTQDQRAIFAPTNQAFTNFLDDLGIDLPANVIGLDTILAYHIVNANVSASNLAQTNFQFLQTSNSNVDIFVNRSGGNIRLDNGVSVVSSNDTGNGTIHTIDGVLTARRSLRSYVESVDEYSIFLSLMNLRLRNAADDSTLVGNLSSQLRTKYRTFFIPTNAAFVALLADFEVADVDELIEALEDIVAEELGDDYEPRHDGVPIEGFRYLQNILRYHVSATPYYSANLTNNLNLATIFTGEKRARVIISGSDITILDSNDDAAALTPNPMVYDIGFVHELDKVLLPEIDF
ncbi:MAG: fasciclin domain-containing protein [Cyclobacteriaceae bacterium]